MTDAAVRVFHVFVPGITDPLEYHAQAVDISQKGILMLCAIDGAEQRFVAAFGIGAWERVEVVP